MVWPMKLVVHLSFALCYVSSYVTEAPDGSVCFNGCNGHGDCVDYSCHCWAGYLGDDCGTTFVSEGQKVVPILSAGHYNLTKKNFTSAVIKNKLILVGFSAHSCHKCIVVEPEYEKISDTLMSLGIPFARADTDKMKSIALEHEASELPALVLFQKHRPLPFRGSHTAAAVLAFVDKQVQKPARSLNSIEEVESFLLSRNSSSYSTSTVMVVGFFADYSGIEEDDYDDYVEIAKDLQTKEDVYFGTVTNSKVCDFYKKNKTIDRTPSVILFGENGIKAINLDELYGEKYGLKEWINRNAIPLVGKLTNNNFKLYEKIPNPMLMLFLDLSQEHSTSNPGQILGGKSGKILNENLMEEFRYVAKEHSEKITFVYLDGLLHEDRMKSLGLFGGKERLPSLAFNTRDNLQIPFPEELPINRDTLLQFCADFISGKLKSVFDATEMAKKVMQSVKPVNPKNKAVRKKKKEAPKEVKGVSEQYNDGSQGDLAVTTITLANFEKIVMDEGKDVVLMLHAKGSEACSHFAVYYKHMANRFKELNIPSLVIARMDLTDESPPTHMGLVVGTLPIVVILPAGSKIPPWTFYSGVGKVTPLMKWVQENSEIPFDLPNLPHLTVDQKVMYKEQVREREEHLETQRRNDKRAIDGEDRARKEIERKKRNKLKKNIVNEMQVNENDFSLSKNVDSTIDGEVDTNSTREAIEGDGELLAELTKNMGKEAIEQYKEKNKNVGDVSEEEEEEEEEERKPSAIQIRREAARQRHSIESQKEDDKNDMYESTLRRKRGSNSFAGHSDDNDEF